MSPAEIDELVRLYAALPPAHERVLLAMMTWPPLHILPKVRELEWRAAEEAELAIILGVTV
jgi:hypothetical protein